MKVLDLFAGLGGWSAAFLDRGHDVTHVELDPVFEPEVCADVFDLSPDDLGGPGAFDLILASPPCQQFSVMRIGHNWTTDNRPKTWAAANAVRLVRHTAALIDGLEPRWFVMENPCGKLRTLVKRGLVSPLMMSWERRTITYCTYGAPWQKRTDLWGGFPPALELREQCSNDNPCSDQTRKAKPSGPRKDADKRYGAYPARHPELSGNGGSFGHVAPQRGSASGVQTGHLSSPRNVGGGAMPGGSKSPDDHDRSDGPTAHPLVRAFYEAAAERYGLDGRALQRAPDEPHISSLGEEGFLHTSRTNEANRLGTWDQSVLAAVRSLVPYELSLDVCLAAEASIEAGAPTAPAGRLL